MKLTVRKDLGPLRLAAVAKIVELARRNREKHITPGKDGVYVMKRDEAIRWLAAGEPEDLSDFPFMAEEVGKTAPDVYQLAQIWLNRNDFVATYAGPRIEGREVSAKLAIEAATTPAEIDAVVAGWADV